MAAKQFVQELEDQRKEQLVRATYEEVAEKGYSAVTLQDIATRAGVSKGSTLYYFPSKEDLFLAALEWMIEQMHERQQRAVDSATEPVAQLRAAIGTIFDAGPASRQFFLAYSDFVSLGTRNKRFYELNRRFYEGCTCIDQAILTRGIETGNFRVVDLTEASSMIRALIDGLMLQWFFSPEADMETYRDRCERVVLAYLMGESSPQLGRDGAQSVKPSTESATSPLPPQVRSSGVGMAIQRSRVEAGHCLGRGWNSGTKN
jgi:TetR/AcrR family fatty acid metabolism transcriptional regulator